MKRMVWTLVAGISLALCGVATIVLLAMRPILHGDPAGADPVRIDVPAGTVLAGIADRLHAAGVVRHTTIFKRYAMLESFDRQIRAGEYEFVAGESYRRILERLREGDIVQIKATLPEGITCREVGELLERKLGIKNQEFLAAVQDPELLRRHNIESPSLEGYLFPDTYFFPTKTTARQALEMMLQRFFTVWTPKMEERARAIGMTRGQVLSLASIIENEALLDSERPRISAVYHNRLNIDMLLQADPTVLYALGGIHRRVLYRDLRVSSPYNTYVNPGLPPGPICNPGLVSIEAALSPLPGSRDLFFVAANDGTGRHVFTRTLGEHMTAKRRADTLLEQRSADANAESPPSSSKEDLAPPAPAPPLKPVPTSTQGGGSASKPSGGASTRQPANAGKPPGAAAKPSSNGSKQDGAAPSKSAGSGAKRDAGATLKSSGGSTKQDVGATPSSSGSAAHGEAADASLKSSADSAATQRKSAKIPSSAPPSQVAVRDTLTRSERQ